MRRWQGVDPLYKGLLGMILATEVQVVIDGGSIDSAGDKRCGEERFGLGSEDEPVRVGQVVERLDPEAIA